jgi:hypothetical protein
MRGRPAYDWRHRAQQAERHLAEAQQELRLAHAAYTDVSERLAATEAREAVLNEWRESVVANWRVEETRYCEMLQARIDQLEALLRARGQA